MKKLFLVLALVFPFTAFAEEIPSTVDDAVNQRYFLHMGVQGGIHGAAIGSDTTQKLDGISYALYTVSYAVIVDAIREIVTKAWRLDSEGLPEGQMNAIMANPKSMICQ